MTGPDLTPEQRERLVHAVTALPLGSVVDLVVRMMADADRQGAARVTAAVESVLACPALYDVLCDHEHSKGWSHDEVDRLIRAALPVTEADA